MPTTKYSALATLSSIIFLLGLLPTPVNSYDCTALVNMNDCPAGLPGPQSGYPECLVQKYGASAFIQCASQNGVPKFRDNSDGDTTYVSALNVLTSTLSRPACGDCPLAQNIQGVAKNLAPSPDGVNFGAELCKQINPSDAGMCCLKNCLMGTPEHSIHAFCAGTVADLTKAPLLPNNCVSNAESTSDDSSGNTASSGRSSDSSDSSSSDDNGSSTAAPSSSSTVSTSSMSSAPRPVSTSATTPAVANSATTTSATSTSQPAQATPKTGAVSGRQITVVDLLKRLAVGIVPILAAL